MSLLQVIIDLGLWNLSNFMDDIIWEKIIDVLIFVGCGNMYQWQTTLYKLFILITRYDYTD